jgi:hypothetical protein
MDGSGTDPAEVRDPEAMPGLLESERARTVRALGWILVTSAAGERHGPDGDPDGTRSAQRGQVRHEDG